MAAVANEPLGDSIPAGNDPADFLIAVMTFVVLRHLLKRCHVLPQLYDAVAFKPGKMA